MSISALFNKYKKLFFYLVLIILPILLVLLFEIFLRIINYGNNLDLFIKSINYPGYYEINKNVAKRYFSKFDGTAPSNDIFLIQKPENCYRVFVMGCSTTRGFPYDMNVTFSRILNYRLQDAFPNKKIEIVNTAMAAVNSYTQADFIDEILKNKPDAILIYTGHNEYYGALGVGSVENGGNARWIKKLHISLIKFRTYQLIQNTVRNVLGLFNSNSDRISATLMERMAKEKAIPYKSELYTLGIEQFKLNMEEVVQKIKKAHVSLIFSNVISNINGNPPFKSINEENYPLAEKVFEEAKNLEKVRKYDEANKKYYLAKDLDAIRFRAPEDINIAINDICLKYNIPILNMKEVFENASKNGIVGNALMTEHLHPNVEGYFLMADAFFCKMMNLHYIADVWDHTKIKPSIYYRENWGFSSLDSLVADLKVKTLKAGWPFKAENVINNFKYTYKPTSLVDSFALMCVKYVNVSIESKHIELAKIYINKGEKRKAFKEYYSLIKNSPFRNEYYYPASNLLIEIQEYPKALELMQSMPNNDTIFFADVQIGKILQHLNEHKLALESFEKAKSFIGINDSKEYLLRAELNSLHELKDSINFLKVLKEIQQIDPNFKPNDIKKKEIFVYLDNQVKDLVMRAIELAKQKQYNNALDLLEESIKIKETPFALKMMGGVLFQLHDNRALSYLEKAYKSDPLDLSTINNLIVLYVNQSNFDMATRMLNEYKKLSSDSKRVQQLSVLIEKKRRS